MLTDWLKRIQSMMFSKSRRRAVQLRRKRPLLARILEQLEDRIVPSTTILNNPDQNNQGQGFAGLNFDNSVAATPPYGFVPPDTVGAAGLDNLVWDSNTQATVNHGPYVEGVNQAIAIYDKNSTGAPRTDSANRPVTASLYNFFHTVGGLPKVTANASFVDETVTFDELIPHYGSPTNGPPGSFIIGDLERDTNTHQSVFDLAISTSDNPTTLTAADWSFLQITTTETTFATDVVNHQGQIVPVSLDADYPGNLGYNYDAIFITLDMDTVTPNLNHAEIIAVNPTTLEHHKTDFYDLPALAHSINYNQISVRPVTMHDSVTGDPMWLVTEHIKSDGTSIDGKSIDVIKMQDYNTTDDSATFQTFNLKLPQQYQYAEARAPLNPDNVITTSLFTLTPSPFPPAKGLAEFDPVTGVLTVQVQGADPNSTLEVEISGSSSPLTGGLMTDNQGNGVARFTGTAITTLNYLTVGDSDGDGDLDNDTDLGEDGLIDDNNLTSAFFHGVTGETDGIDSRIDKAAEANNTIVAAHAVTPVGSSTQDVAQWYAIDVSDVDHPTLFEEGRINTGNNTYVTYPGIDISSSPSGQIGLTYSTCTYP